MIGRAKARLRRREAPASAEEPAEETGPAQASEEPKGEAFIHTWLRVAHAADNNSESPSMLMLTELQR